MSVFKTFQLLLLYCKEMPVSTKGVPAEASLLKTCLPRVHVVYQPSSTQPVVKQQSRVLKVQDQATCCILAARVNDRLRDLPPQLVNLGLGLGPGLASVNNCLVLFLSQLLVALISACDQVWAQGY